MGLGNYSPNRSRNLRQIIRRRLVNGLDPVGIQMRGVTPAVAWRHGDIIGRTIMAGQRRRRIGRNIAVIFVLQTVGFIFGMIQNINPLGVKPRTLARRRFNQNIRPRLVRLGDNFQRRTGRNRFTMSRSIVD